MMAEERAPSELCSSIAQRLRNCASTAQVFREAKRYRCQILLGRVVDGQLVQERIRWDGGGTAGEEEEEEYFYPASTIKLCVVVAALEYFNNLHRKTGVKVELSSSIDFLKPNFEAASAATVNSSGRITFASLIRHIFLVSSNPAYNMLFSLIGRDEINKTMKELGLAIRLVHQLSDGSSQGGDDELHRFTCYARVKGYNTHPNDRRIPWDVEFQKRDTGEVEQLDDNITLGRGYVPVGGGEIVRMPMECGKKNYASLEDLQRLLCMIVRPDVETFSNQHHPPALSTATHRRINIDEAQRLFLMEAMQQLPNESTDPLYSEEDYQEDYNKFFLKGVRRACCETTSRQPKILNKLGRALGFSVDNAYIFDVNTGDAFFLSAVLYTNDNGILNDDDYEYAIADTFLEKVAEIVTTEIWAPP